MIKYKNRLLNQIEIYILPICIILLSFIKFYVANIKRLDIYGVAELSKIFTIIIIAILLLTFIFSKLNKLKFNENLFFLSLCFYSLFFHYNLKNIVIWPDDVRKILKFFPIKSIAEIKILFPDPWPKKKHKNRRLIQNEFIKTIYPIIKHQGTVTIATDHDLLKKWVLEKFQNYKEFEWVVKSSNDWRLRPKDCFQTKYELKSINQKRKPSWFIFKKK